MVNPAGYTALDMIGFTDKGIYSSSDNYVKNDLVHYSGNIWRCLIDDTSGIAPAEGVNWTLFIGEPTNLVERIIAPVETDPATNAWAVGRQIIFNDNLYEVIVAITAGDALVTYEDDPTNANIKLADPVETQLLNLKGNVSNRNLLDNAWFTVNQRGQNSYTNDGYTVDRWLIFHGSLAVSNGIVFTKTDDNAIVYQYIENDTVYNKTCTLSAIIDGVLYKTSGTVPSGKTASWQIIIDEQVTSAITIKAFVPPSNYVGDIRVELIFSDSTAHTLRAIKLELGSVSTLAQDTAPNYATELLKCQRYFVNLNPLNISWAKIGVGMANSATSLPNVKVNLPVSMRATPALSLSGKIGVGGEGTYSLFSNGDYTPSVDVFEGASVLLTFAIPTANLTVNALYQVGFHDNVGVLQLSADL